MARVTGPVVSETMRCDNMVIAEQLRDYADLLEEQAEETFGSRAYLRASDVVTRLDRPISRRPTTYGSLVLQSSLADRDRTPDRSESGPFHPEGTWRTPFFAFPTQLTRTVWSVSQDDIKRWREVSRSSDRVTPPTSHSRRRLWP